MKRRSMLCMIAAAFLLCWGGVVSCSSDSSGDPPAPEVHDGVWKINYGDKAFVGTSEGATANKTHASYPGYDGSYIDGLGGGYVDYAINATEEQDVQILLHYGYWGYKHALRGAQIVVNGVTDTDIIYCNWTNEKNTSNIWQDSNAITIRLKAGDNALRVVPVRAGTPMPEATYPEGVAETDKTWTAEGNLPNIDYLQITGKGLSAGSATVSYYQVKVSGDFGTVDLSPKQDYYAKDTKVTLTATPKAGYKFDAWWGTRAYDEEEWKIPVTEELNLTAHFIPEDYIAPNGLVGYATITDDAGTKYTITGGANGETIMIGNHSDLTTNAEKLSSDIPHIVLFTNGTRITTNDNKSEYYTVGSNKTIYGTVKGAGLKNIELRISGDNVIVRNMVLGEVIGDDTFSGTGNDALSINGAKHVWIDHCELFSNLEPKNNDGTPATDASEPKEWYDGLLDVKNGATWITVSNCYLHDHWKAVLCGSGDDHDDGDSAMRITFVGNYFENINSRQPLFRWGKAHIYNNYYKGASDKQANCIDVRIDSQVLAEGNYFESVKNAIGIDLANGKSNTMGKAEYNFPNSNKLDSCTNTPSKGSSSYKPLYQYTPKSADEAKAAAENLKESVFIDGLVAN